MRFRGWAAGAVIVLSLLGASSAQANVIYNTDLVSVSGTGVGGTNTSTTTSISEDGRYIAFASSATNLVVGDTNGKRDVFVRDTQAGTTTLVSKATNGTLGDELSSMPSISSDGRYVAFESFANNLDGGALNKGDIFVHDRNLGTTSLVSRASNYDAGLDGSHHPSISGDGSRIAFYSYADNFSAIDDNAVPNTFVRDMNTDTTILVSRSTGGVAGDGEAVNPAISANGEVVAFQSMADNLVSGSPDANLTVDVFVHNLTDQTTTYVSKATDGTPGTGDSSGDSANPSLSADGRYVAFASRADTLAPDDALFLSDIFVHDLDTGETTHVSRASDGTPGNGPPFGSFNATLSADGRYVAFSTTFTNLSDEDFDGLDVGGNDVSDVFVHDRDTGETRYVSRSTAGVAGDRSSYLPFISGDGRFVSYNSEAETLSDIDAEDVLDVFVSKLLPEPPANVDPPALSGAGEIGEVLSCGTGNWDGGTVTQVWRRNGTPIPGATGLTYTLTADDGGTTIDCLVTAANNDGSTSIATTSLDIPAAPEPPENVTPPALTGTGEIGATLTCDTGSWDDGTVTQVWRRNGTPIPGATGLTYSLTTDDAGSSIDCFVTATNADGSTSVSTAAIDVPAIPTPPENVTTPSLSGTGAVGRTLVCDTGSWDDGTITQVWRRDGTPIPGATGPTYTLTDADAGTTIDCLVTATNSDGSTSVATTAITVAAVPPPDVIKDRKAPRLTKVSLLRKKFRVGKGRRRGTILRFRLSERATVRVEVQKRKGKRWRTAGTIRKRNLGNGRRAIRVSGKFRKKRLSPGRYRLRITATDKAGNRSKTIRRFVRVVR